MGPAGRREAQPSAARHAGCSPPSFVRKSRRIALALAAVALVVVAARAALPIWLRGVVAKEIARVEGYRGRVADVDLALYRGAFRLEGLDIRKHDGGEPVPFLSAERFDVTIDWQALADGAFVAEIELLRPRLDFVAGRPPTGEEGKWLKRLEELYPFAIDRFALIDGRIRFRDPHRDPPVDVALHDVQLEARNLTNSRELSAERPARVTLRARAQDTGRIAAELELDPFAPRPKFRLGLEVASLQLPELDSFLRAYAGVDVERGTFDLSSEVTAEGGRFEGWVQPLLRDVDVLRVEKESEEQGFFATLWEGLVGATSEMLENQPEDQVATRIPVRGTFEQPDIGVIEAIANLLRNGYVEALRPRMELLREDAKRKG
jgi:hypothetical protein